MPLPPVIQCDVQEAEKEGGEKEIKRGHLNRNVPGLGISKALGAGPNASHDIQGEKREASVLFLKIPL